MHNKSILGTDSHDYAHIAKLKEVTFTGNLSIAKLKMATFKIKPAAGLKAA